MRTKSLTRTAPDFREKWRTCGIALAVLVISTVAWPQDAGLLSTTILMPETDEFYRDNQPGHRSYVELDELKFTLMAANESELPVIADATRFREAFSARVGSDFSIPVTLEWLTLQEYEAKGPMPAAEREKVVIQPGEMVTWTLAVRRTDGQRFTWGDYPVSLSVGDLRQAFSTSDGATFAGRLTEATTFRRTVSIKAPASPAETARRWAITASAAADRGDDETSLQAMLRAADADPRLQDNTALLFLAAGRYQQAVNAYESMASRKGGLRDLEVKFLAQAYLGIGAESKAFELLRQAGIPQESVADELAIMRRRISDRALETRR